MCLEHIVCVEPCSWVSYTHTFNVASSHSTARETKVVERRVVGVCELK